MTFVAMTSITLGSWQSTTITRNVIGLNGSALSLQPSSGAKGTGDRLRAADDSQTLANYPKLQTSPREVSVDAITPAKRKHEPGQP